MTVQSSFVPTATILADKTELCQGQIFRFEVKEVTGGGTNPTYQWRRNSTNITNETNINLSTSTLATNDTISVEVTSSATCAVPRKAISNKIVVKVNTVAMGNASGGFNASKNPICVGEEVTFTTKPQNFVTNPIMMWFVNDVLVLNKEALSPADYSYASNSLNNGDKVKVWITSSYKCLQTDTVKENAITVTVNQPQNPTVNISTTNNPICAGESAVFKASGTLKGTAPTFQWKVNGANSGASTTDSTITISSLSNGSIVTVQMRSNATCLTKDTVTSPPVVMTVEASVVPAIQIIADATTRCSGEVFNFQVAGIGGGGTNPTYQWTRNGTVIPNQTSDKLSISNLANNDTIRGVIISSAVCAAPPTTTSNPIVVQVNQTPPAINLAGNSPKIIGCQGEVVTLDATSPLTGATYLWNTGATSNAINVNFSGIYYVTVTSPIGNCKTTDTVEVELLTKPIVNLAADQTICEGDTAVLDAGANASYTYQWSNGATTPKITVKDGGTYKVRVRIGNSATCEAQAEQKVNIAPNPTVALEPQYTFCADELPGIAVEAKSTDAVSYLWSTGENTPTIFVTKPETLSLTAKNAQGCITNITTSVMNECKPVLIVPNAFTPNNDIKNDYFQVYGRNIGAFEIYIFNRWGEQIFYSNDINEKWWGKYLGAPVPTGLYVYKIKYKGSLPNSKEETLQGEIQVLR
jgi:gliding motility-associated-like protein